MYIDIKDGDKPISVGNVNKYPSFGNIYKNLPIPPKAKSFYPYVIAQKYCAEVDETKVMRYKFALCGKVELR